MASRGARGRGLSGRGGSQAKSTAGGGSVGKSKIPKNIKELETYLKSMNESNLDAYSGMFADMVLGYSTNEHKLQEAVNLIFDTTCTSRDYATLGARVCEAIATPDSATASRDSDQTATLRANFLQQLLSRFQTEYKRKDQIRATSIEAWLGVFSFLCEVYARIRVGNQPITVIGKAIFSTIEYLLSQKNIVDDEVDCICTNLKSCGKQLEAQSKDTFEKVLINLRKMLISRKSSCQVRCLILELIEFKHMGWSDPQQTLNRFYVDAIADAVAEDELGESYS